jgi:hypothetical protein
MTRLATPTLAKLLALSLLPMLTFAGHWEPRIDIPFTNYYWGLPEFAHSHSGASHDHSDHCHGESATCATKPVTSGIGFALLRDSLLLLGAAAIATRVAVTCWKPAHWASVRPELQPPQAVVA